LSNPSVKKEEIKAIGISYQMHGLVVIDKNRQVLRPSIIWCDSRAIQTGEMAFEGIGPERCLSRLLNSPGNFTASKLKWVKENEPQVYEKIYKIMLPGDFVAFKLSGEISTTPSGLSEGIFWDFQSHEVSPLIMEHYGFNTALIPDLVPNIGLQCKVSEQAARELGLVAGTPVTYRAGDQPNNAFSLNVLNPGEIAATAGTSGVVFGVSDQVKFDPLSRVNTFAHVNQTPDQVRLGVLLCINGTGSMNSWLKRNVGENLSYDDMNQLSAQIDPGANGLKILPFGNGAERMTGNKDTGCIVDGLNFNRHNKSHLIRAAHEGIVYSFKYGMDIMAEIGITPKIIRAGHANMFLSPVFRECLSSLTNTPIELYNTDGSQGAARGGGLGAGIFAGSKEAFAGLEVIQTIEPDLKLKKAMEEEFHAWKQVLNKNM
jgi:xylulokinase